MANAENTDIERLNRERKPHPNRRAFIGTSLGLVVGAGLAYGVPEAYRWAVGENGKDSNVPLQWKATDLQSDTLSWQEFAGDPHAGELQRNWHILDVMTVNANAYDTTRLALEQDLGYQLMQAVGYVADGKTNVGIHGDGQDFLGILNPGGPNAERVAALRQGFDGLHGSIGYYDEHRDRLILAPSVQNAGTTTISQLGHDFPGAVWS